MIRQLSWRLSILAFMLAGGAGSAMAQTTSCTGTLAPGSYNAVNVPAAATCTVAGSGNVTVTGNLTVGSGASLLDYGVATFTINSSLLAVGANTIYLVPQAPGAVNILGSVSVTGATNTVQITDSFIGGTLSVANSPISAYIYFNGDNVAGSLLDRGNTTPAFSNNIESNTIGASLVCSGNTPSGLPQDGGLPNTVGGSKVGQCSGL
jgi:hypothetical protein